MENLHVKLPETVQYIQSKLNSKPRIGLILGSGLGGLVEEISDKVELPYGEIPHFPVSTVEGHAGQLVFGSMHGQAVVAMQGRFHLYEGYTAQHVVYPVWVMQQLGVEILLVTNAAGGVNVGFKPGDLVLMRDHINLQGTSPLVGVNYPELGPRFPDMSDAYSVELRQVAKNVAAELGIDLREGVYGGLLGPSYETPAEIRYLRTIGADQVGMSSVQETIAANHCGIRVLGISCITNMAAGILPQKLSHAEVMATANLIQTKFKALVAAIVKQV
ncbi:MAG: purine-nucleoside phosphorylase [Peptococcaceae bacterium]|nr:purine-nucleoside phosphorylase [Peptococcaceae bacterium]